MRHHYDFEIDGVKYAGNQFAPSKALRIFARLVRIAGKPVAALLGEDFSSLKIDKELVAKVLGAKLNLPALVESIAEVADPDEIDSLTKALTEGLIVYVDGKSRDVSFEIDFQGRIGHLFKVIGKVLVNQFADVFGVAVARPVVPAKQSGHIQAV